MKRSHYIIWNLFLLALVMYALTALSYTLIIGISMFSNVVLFCFIVTIPFLFYFNVQIIRTSLRDLANWDPERQG